MESSNPFAVNSVLLETGFYYDRDGSRIVYAYRDKSYEDPYLRVYTKDNRSVNVERLIDLSDVENQMSNLNSDFEWICSTDAVREAFSEYLLEQELYILLDKFKTFCTVCDNFVPPFVVGDIVEAVDDYYQITKKSFNFLGQVVEVYSNGALKVKILKHDFAKYVGKLADIKEIQHIQKIN